MIIDTYRGVSGSSVKFSILHVNVSLGNASNISKLQHLYISTAAIYNFSFNALWNYRLFKVNFKYFKMTWTSFQQLSADFEGVSFCHTT